MATTEDREDGWICRAFNGGEESFPCDATPIHLVSLALAAGGVGLLMTVWLTHQVRYSQAFSKQKHPNVMSFDNSHNLSIVCSICICAHIFFDSRCMIRLHF